MSEVLSVITRDSMTACRQMWCLLDQKAAGSQLTVTLRETCAKETSEPYPTVTHFLQAHPS